MKIEIETVGCGGLENQNGSQTIELTNKTPLEALERIKKSHHLAMSLLGIKEDTETLEAIDTVEQALTKAEENEKKAKAFDIMIKKRVNVQILLIARSLCIYNEMIGTKNRLLTEEEYYSIKEMFGK